MKNKFLLSGALFIGAGGICAFLMISGGSLPGKAGPLAVAATAQHTTKGGRTVYPYSLVPGGVLTTKELTTRPDSYARKFYGDIDYKSAVMWRSYGGSFYNSYRVGNRIYQKTKRTPLPPGELLVKVQRRSGEPIFIKSRCGNLLLDKVSEPTEAESRQPSDKTLGDETPDTPTPPNPKFLSMLDKVFSVPDIGTINLPQDLQVDPSSDGDQEHAMVDGRRPSPDGAFYMGGGFLGGGFAGGVPYGQNTGSGTHNESGDGGGNGGSGGGSQTPQPPPPGVSIPPQDNPPPTVTPEPSEFVYVIVAGVLLIGLRRMKFLSKR
jgi:hypothetical protein